MRIEGLSNGAMFHEPSRRVVTSREKDFSSVVNMKEAATKGVNLPKNATKHMVQDYAEWYFKLGKTYESANNYKQAISAYEKSYSEKPDMSKAQMADTIRGKLIKDGSDS